MNLRRLSVASTDHWPPRIGFLTDRQGNIVSLSAPLEPIVKDIVFVHLAAGDCSDAAFREWRESVGS
jgi:hypothetical protein